MNQGKVTRGVGNYLVRGGIVIGVIALVLVGLIDCEGSESASSTSKQQPEEVKSQNATLELQTRWEGTFPEPRTISTSGHEQACGADTLRDRSVVVSPEGQVKNVALVVESGPEGIWRERSTPVRIDQRNCHYRPRVVVAQPDQPIHITDSDPGLHNVRATFNRRQVFNYSTYQTQELTERFDQVGTYRLACDVHPWMESFILVVNHGQATVTNEVGVARLTDLPPGEYELFTWHEEYGEHHFSVTLEPGENRTIQALFPQNKIRAN